jgi:dTDP-L-rhamnose 4-epimerase
MTARQALVTGGAGFIGSHLVDHLLHQGYAVRVLDNLNPQIHGADPCRPDYFPDDAAFVFGDVRDRRALEHALRGVDTVFHLAAETGVGQSMYEAGSYARTNVVGTASLWDAIHAIGGVERMVLASSRAVYGEGTYQCSACGRVRPEARSRERLAQGLWSPTCPGCGSSVQPVATSEEDETSPSSVYAVTKVSQEQMSFALGRSHGVRVVVLRFFNVYGSRQALSNPYTGILATFVARLRSGKPLLVYEDGEQLRDFVHVTDVARACELASRYDDRDFAVFNVGSGHPVTILQLAQKILELRGPASQKDHTGIRVTGHYRVGDIRDCYASIEKSRSELRYEPQVSLEDGLREFLSWAQSQPLVDQTDEAAGELYSAGLLGQAQAGRGR